MEGPVGARHLYSHADGYQCELAATGEGWAMIAAGFPAVDERFVANMDAADREWEHYRAILRAGVSVAEWIDAYATARQRVWLVASDGQRVRVAHEAEAEAVSGLAVAGGDRPAWAWTCRVGDVWRVELFEAGRAVRDGDRVHVVWCSAPAWRLHQRVDQMRSIELRTVDPATGAVADGPGTDGGLLPVAARAAPRPKTGTLMNVTPSNPRIAVDGAGNLACTVRVHDPDYPRDSVRGPAQTGFALPLWSTALLRWAGSAWSAPRVVSASVFEALRERRTIACCRGKVALWTRVAGQPMGSVVEAGGPVTMEAQIASPVPIATVSLWRDDRWLEHRGVTGDRIDVRFTDADAGPGEHHYVVRAQSIAGRSCRSGRWWRTRLRPT